VVHLSAYCKAAIKGFFQSIALSTSANSLQDTLRLLTLWFEYGQWPEVNEALAEGIKTVQIENWLQVISPIHFVVELPHISAVLITH
jgi:serine/threonine-protein kinase mTOR